MKALVFREPGNISLEENFPDPCFKGEGAIVKVKSSSICATDIKIFQKGHFKIAEKKEKRILGHEIFGEVIEVQDNYKDLIPIGSKVFVAPNLGCGKCDYCLIGKYNLCPEYDAFGITLNGAFAEYIYIPKEALEQGNVIPLERDVDKELVPLIEPLSTCLYNLDNLKLKIGDRILVFGAGFMGLLNAISAKLSGASLVGVCDLRDDRLKIVEEFDIGYALNPTKENLEEKVKEITNGKKFDIVIVTVPDSQVQEESLRLVSPLGKISFFAGLPAGGSYTSLNTNLIHYNQLTITGTTGADIDFYKRALRFMTYRKELQRFLKSIITIFSLTDIEKGFEKQLQGEILKAVIDNES